jgi:tetratricopeptide (TPR) repeat protein
VPQTVGRALLGSAIVVLCGLTIGRNREYRTGLGIWQTVVERRPQGRAHYNLGLELKKVGRRADAIREYQVAAPTHPEALYALGFELDADGQHAAAVDQYRTFIARKPLDVNVPRAYHQVGRAMMTLGRYDDAMVAFREVLARKAGDADALAGLADSLLAAERWSDAVTAYTQFLSRNPNDSNARLNMGLALVRLDRDPEARDAFAAVVQQQPDNVAAHVNLAFALANTGRLGDAGREFRRAAELETDPAARADIEGAIRQLLGAH